LKRIVAPAKVHSLINALSMVDSEK